MTEQHQEQESYVGNLRPRIFYDGQVTIENGSVRAFNLFRIEWIEGKNVSNVVFTESIKVPVGMSFVPQISAYGTHDKKTGFYVDENDKRHFVLDAKQGIFGNQMGSPESRKQ